MNANYVIYEKATGTIVQAVFCQRTVVDLYAQDDGLASMEVEAMIDPSKYRVVNGSLVAIEADTSQSYAEQRMYAYPAVTEQLDALWHAMDQGILPKIEPMYSDVKAVKLSIPKSNN